MLKVVLPFYLSALSLSFAQETCETLLAGLEQTLAQTRSLERTTTIKAGLIEMASVSAVVKQTSSGLEVTETERSGRQLPDGPSNSELEEGWLGPFGTEVFSCEGHGLKQLAGSRYELELMDKDEASPPQNFKLSFKLEAERFVLERLTSKIKAPGLPISPHMTVTFENWVFTEAE